MILCKSGWFSSVTKASHSDCRNDVGFEPLLTNGCRRSRKLFGDIFFELRAVLVLASTSDVSVTNVSALTLLSPSSCRL